MIRHCVFARFRPEITAEQKAEIYAGLNDLVGQIDGLLGADFGPNVSPEGKAQGFKDGFIMDLEDREALERYLVDPAHKAAGAKLGAALDGGADGIIVFDLEI